MAATPRPFDLEEGQELQNPSGPTEEQAPQGPLTSTRSLMFWPNTNLLLGASALLVEFSRLRRRWAVSAGTEPGV